MPLDNVDEEEEELFGDMSLTDNQKAFEAVEDEYMEKKEAMMSKAYTRTKTLCEENGYVVVARDFVSLEMADMFTQYALC